MRRAASSRGRRAGAEATSPPSIDMTRAWSWPPAGATDRGSRDGALSARAKCPGGWTAGGSGCRRRAGSRTPRRPRHGHVGAWRRCPPSLPDAEQRRVQGTDGSSQAAASDGWAASRRSRRPGPGDAALVDGDADEGGHDRGRDGADVVVVLRPGVPVPLERPVRPPESTTTARRSSNPAESSSLGAQRVGEESPAGARRAPAGVRPGRTPRSPSVPGSPSLR